MKTFATTTLDQKLKMITFIGHQGAIQLLELELLPYERVNLVLSFFQSITRWTCVTTFVESLPKVIEMSKRLLGG